MVQGAYDCREGLGAKSEPEQPKLNTLAAVNAAKAKVLFIRDRRVREWRFGAEFFFADAGSSVSNNSAVTRTGLRHFPSVTAMKGPRKSLSIRVSFSVRPRVPRASQSIYIYDSDQDAVAARCRR